MIKRSVALACGRSLFRRVGLCALLLVTPAFAAPPPGSDLNNAEHAWWECHIQPATKKLCCRESDGHVLADNEWRIQKRADGVRVYQVHIGPRWYDIPDGAVVSDFSKCGPEPNPAKRAMAKVWYAPTWQVRTIVDITVYCFIAGTMY